MARIYKGSEFIFKLTLKRGGVENVNKIIFYTTDVNNNIEIEEGINILDNVITLEVYPTAFENMEDGVINYIIIGDEDRIEGQSSYYLKTPIYNPTTGIQLRREITITDNGDYTVEPSYGYKGMAEVKVNINVDTETPYYQGVEDQKSRLENITITENGTYEREDGYKSIIVDVPDLNGSYDDGYNVGREEGYNQGDAEGYDRGYAEGDAEGYNRGNEEGYRNGYDAGVNEGINNAGSIIAETAQVLDITENGLYVSRYSEIPTPDVITGVYSDGTEFYSYVELNGKVFNTNITPTPTTRLELWYKGDNIRAGDAWNNIIGSGKYDYNYPYLVRYYMYSNSKISVEVGSSVLTYDWDENAWHHILIAKKTDDASFMSLWVDEVYVGDFVNVQFTPDSTFYINGIESNLGGERRANGWFGMIKIDDQTFIPTADGFLNTNTGELLEVVEEGVYIFTDNTPKVPDGNLIKTVNVNVVPKIDVAKENIKFGYSNITEIPQWVDFEGVKNFNDMFSNCGQLTKIENLPTNDAITMKNMFFSCGSLKNVPLFDTSNVTNMSNMFDNCFQLEEVPLFNTSNVTNMSAMFSLCKALKTIPLFNTSNVTNMSKMFNNCNSLKTIPLLNTSKVTTMANMFEASMEIEEIPPIDTSKVTDMGYMFYSFGDNHKLKKLPEFDCTNVTEMRSYFSYYQNKMPYFTECGGWKNLKHKWDDNYGLRACENLTYESCINILNGLYDFTGNGVTPTSNQAKLKVHQNFLNLVGDEISIGTDKGWTITA